MDVVGPPSTNPDEGLILQAARNGDVDTVRAKLEGNGALMWARQPGDGGTLLHVAISRNDIELATLLLEKGANPEVADRAGRKPLAIAASDSSLLTAGKLLVKYGANVNAFDPRTRQSVLHLCAASGSVELAQILLVNGAQVDSLDALGETPLFPAVRGRGHDMVRLLLQHGANINIRSAEGVTPGSLASGEDATAADILRLLKSSHIIRGPRVLTREDLRKGKRRATTQTLVAKSPAPLDDKKKMIVCHAFKASIIDFHIEETEQRIEKTVSVYDVLYGRGGEDIMREARRGQIEGKPTFRWYHLPANNMEWVEALVRRHFAERSPRTGQYTGSLTADLGMKRSYNEHHLMFTSKGSFIRPFCRNVKLKIDDANNSVRQYIGAFIPYLHFEKHQDFKVMSSEIAAAMDAIARRPLPRHRNTGPVAADDQKSQVGSNAEKQNPGDGSEDGEDKPKRNVLSSDILHKLLIQSYLKVGDDGDEVPPLQVRRTLDHYFYSHLGSTSRRDDDQVVLRYTSNFEGVEPKIFMVDQLWIWILEDDTVISCCPLRWNSWISGGSTNDTADPSRPKSWDFVVRENDPLNIYQTISNYLRNVRRDSIADVKDLCRVVASACLDAFDHYATPDEFHFFDFVEHAIGQVMDRVTKKSEEFGLLLDAAAASNEVLDARSIKIEEETKLLVEAEDIRDELGILRLVLEDQKTVAEQLECLLSHSAESNIKDEEKSRAERARDIDSGEDGQMHTLKGNRVLHNHLSRIQRMEALATRSIQSIRSLLELKQQHASLSEAYSSRRQAEDTTRQARTATSYSKQMAHQLRLSQEQAKETAKQGNIIMLFTVVTVVFLPLSFMTSFFTIELDAFPTNENGKMPIGIILAIILSVSAGVSVPFVLLAFHVDKVKVFIRHVRSQRLMLGMLGIVSLTVFVSLAIILSQPLGAGIKGGMGIGIGLVALMFILGVFLSRLAFLYDGWGEFGSSSDSSR